jgi:hypothetical protein
MKQKEIRFRVTEEEFNKLESKRINLGESSVHSLAKTLTFKQRVIPNLSSDMLELSHFAGLIVAKLQIVVRSNYSKEEVEEEMEYLEGVLDEVDAVVNKYAKNG